MREVDVIVPVYLRMLRLQELGQTFNKSELNRQLQLLLPARSLGSIEYKHRNISAVLNFLGGQALVSYKPLANFQSLPVKVVARSLDSLHRLTGCRRMP